MRNTGKPFAGQSSDRRDACRTEGFTLIELLVVVAIIALLVTILMPSLQRARELAKQAVCASHQHSLGRAMSIYAAEFEAVFPGADGRISSTHPDAAVREGGHHTWRHWFQYLFGPQFHIMVSDDGTHPGWGEYGTQQTPAIRCTKSNTGKYGIYESDNVDANQIQADGIFMERIGKNDPRCPPNWEHFKLFRMDRCPSPANFLLLGCSTTGFPVDQGDYRFQWWVFRGNVTYPWPNTGLWLTHSDKVNALFVDGHVEACGPEALRNVANERCRRSFDPDWGGPGIKGWVWEDGTLGP